MSFRIAVVLVSFWVAAAAHAQTVPYSHEVEEFSLPERGLFDTFGDGVIQPDANWFSLLGNVTESGGTVELASPGQVGDFLNPFPVEVEATSLSTNGFFVNGGGNFTATSTWTGAAPVLGVGFSMAIGAIDGAGDVQQLSIGLSNTTASVASSVGTQAGYSVDVLRVTRSGSLPSGPITSFVSSSVVFSPTEIGSQILLTLAFDDALDEIVASFSLDGGSTTTSFNPESWTFTGSNISLTASSTVPEPGTGALVGLGLLALAGRRR